MSVRLSYEEIEDGIFQSHNILVSESGAKYLVTYDLNTMKYRIKNVLTRRIYSCERKVTNINVLKRKIRARLKSLGVKLKDESRNRSFGICQKGYTQKEHLQKNSEILVKILEKNNILSEQKVE
jgi:hypothetical protein